MARVAHSGMTADEIVENVITTVSTISSKLATVSRASKVFCVCNQPSFFSRYHSLLIYWDVCFCSNFLTYNLKSLFPSQTGTNIKIIHLKCETSVALPIYTSDLSHVKLMEEAQKKACLTKVKSLNKGKTDMWPEIVL